MHKRDMSQDEARKFFEFKTDKSNEFEVSTHDARENDDNDGKGRFAVICKKLPHDNVLFASPKKEIAIAYCNLANEMLRNLKKNGPNAELPKHEMEGLTKAHGLHGLEQEGNEKVIPEVSKNVESCYRRLLEMGKL